MNVSLVSKTSGTGKTADYWYFIATGGLDGVESYEPPNFLKCIYIDLALPNHLQNQIINILHSLNITKLNMMENSITKL